MDCSFSSRAFSLLRSSSSFFASLADVRGLGEDQIGSGRLQIARSSNALVLDIFEFLDTTSPTSWLLCFRLAFGRPGLGRWVCRCHCFRHRSFHAGRGYPRTATRHRWRLLRDHDRAVAGVQGLVGQRRGTRTTRGHPGGRNRICVRRPRAEAQRKRGGEGDELFYSILCLCGVRSRPDRRWGYRASRFCPAWRGLGHGADTHARMHLPRAWKDNRTIDCLTELHEIARHSSPALPGRSPCRAGSLRPRHPWPSAPKCPVQRRRPSFPAHHEQP